MKKSLVVAAFLPLLFIPMLVLADTTGVPQGTATQRGADNPNDATANPCEAAGLGANYTCLRNPLGTTTSIPTIVGRIINAGMTFVGALAFMMFVFGGFTWLTSAGNTEKVKQGTEIMKWAIIGLVIVFSSVALVRFVFGSFTKLT